MFQKSAVRSRKEILDGMLERAFAKSDENGRRMEQLIKQRIGSVQREARVTFSTMSHVFYQFACQEVDAGSNYLNARNFHNFVNGNNEWLYDTKALEKHLCNESKSPLQRLEELGVFLKL